MAALSQIAEKINFEIEFSQFCSFLATDYIKASYPTDPQYDMAYFPPVVLPIV
jgi:hypothetical protein